MEPLQDGNDGDILRYDIPEIMYPDMSWLNQAMLELSSYALPNESIDDAAHLNHSTVNDTVFTGDLASEIPNLEFAFFDRQEAAPHEHDTAGDGNNSFPIFDSGVLDFLER